MHTAPFSYFTDAVLRGPTIGSMLMCMTAALIGVIIFLRKQSLLGEALSHAAYPGVMCGVILAGILSIDDSHEILIALFIMLGAFVTALLGLAMINWLEHTYRIRSDSALCFVLSTFFGIGLTLASEIQFSYSLLYRQVQAYLYGQAATMVDVHIIIYGIFSIITITLILLFDKELEIIIFNREYAKSLGINVSAINSLIFILTTLAIVIGIRSVGVVLMSAMLIAPAAAARQYTNRFHVMLALAGFFGLISGYLGNYLSVEIAFYLTGVYPGLRLALATGPMIVLVASTICIASLFLAPKRGLLLRQIRAWLFRSQCVQENLLKMMWRQGPHQNLNFNDLIMHHSISMVHLHIILRKLIKKGWLRKTDKNQYQLTDKGQQKAARIVRLHQLWEVYLVDHLGLGVERVHRNADEMEHIITPEIEQQLMSLLNNRKNRGI